MMQKLEWNSEITNRKEKEILAKKIADRVKDGEVIGFGSGSTSFLAVCAIADRIKKENISITAIPTSYEIKQLCNNFKIPTTSIVEKKPDWCFDGADQVDKNGWLIKGRGAAMFKEKINIVNSKENYILVDNSKLVDKIGGDCPVPVECYPDAVNYVKDKLMELGAIECNIRMAIKKDGPIITENGNIILDTKFKDIGNLLEKQIKEITGVIESGLFIDYNVKIINEV